MNPLLDLLHEVIGLFYEVLNSLLNSYVFLIVLFTVIVFSILLMKLIGNRARGGVNSR